MAAWGVRSTYRSIKWHLNLRTLKVPEICPECKENLHPSDVKWIGGTKAQCPHCGISLKVTKGW